MNERFKQVYKQTFLEANSLLDKHGKCVILRPTGFGKTVMMSQIASQFKYEKVLYVYPTAIVKKQAQRNIPESKVTWCTYYGLGKYHDKVEEFYKQVVSKYDLIIFDEMHHMGAAQVKETVSKLLILIDASKIHILGGTATPKRMDGYDIIDAFFDNCITSFYGMDNAISDGIITKLTYVYSIDGYKDSLKDFSMQYSKLDEAAKSKVRADVKKSVSGLDKLTNASNIISKTTNSVYNNKLPSYMRFLVFYTAKDILDRRGKEVLKWFKCAFPTYNINTPLIVISGSNSQKSVEKLANLQKSHNTIDLIYSINMLNEGYHIDNITGIVLLRPTQSPTVYTQQVGRCMQVGVEHSPIVFDFVSNISIHTLFDFAPVKTQKSLELTVGEQLDKLNEVSASNITLIDNVAPVKAIINKMEASLPKQIESEVIAYRKENYAPADALHEKFGISVWEVFQILDKYEDELKPLGLEKQEQDKYIRGDINAGKIKDLEVT